MNPSPDPELELLRSGLESYLPAMNAIVAFRRRIQKACEDVLSTHAEDIRQALGVKIGAEHIVPRRWPTSRKWDGGYADVGAQIKEIGKAQVTLYLVVGWTSEPNEPLSCFATLGLWFHVAEYGRKAKQLLTDKLLLSEDSDFWAEEDRSMGASQTIATTDAPLLEVRLTAVLKLWLDFWRGVGGLKALNGK